MAGGIIPHPRAGRAPRVLVVEDHQVAEVRGEVLGDRLELLDQARLGVLAALLEGQCQVVDAARGLLGVARLTLGLLAPCPLVGRVGIALIGEVLAARMAKIERGEGEFLTVPELKERLQNPTR